MFLSNNLAHLAFHLFHFISVCCFFFFFFVLLQMLNGELKQLYTAITRARVNLWIFDEDNDKRAPAFKYFIKREFVQVVKADEKKGKVILKQDSNRTVYSAFRLYNKEG